MTAPHQDWPWDEATVKAVVKRLESSPHRVHQGAANIILNEFSQEGEAYRAIKLAEENGWPREAVLAGFELARKAAK
jgi:hypothetical protein